MDTWLITLQEVISLEIHRFMALKWTFAFFEVGASLGARSRCWGKLENWLLFSHFWCYIIRGVPKLFSQWANLFFTFIQILIKYMADLTSPSSNFQLTFPQMIRFLCEIVSKLHEQNSPWICIYFHSSRPIPNFTMAVQIRLALKLTTQHVLYHLYLI